MVSGWDKNPGEGNDYAHRPWTKEEKRKAFVILLVVVTLIFATRYFL